ncbi:hypothetical protein [Stutzerimonas kunmingensis]|uniref:hypothetical protein n=1 Tax=Stutzerimonas kunmingensis TaxID=1211807 RepID=UPI0028AA498E|nr:hypothetical protein [Stutzerimonas kunmingensis]
MHIKDIDPQQQYTVQLAQPVDILGRRYYPGQPLTLRGDVLTTVADKVRQATVAPQPGA